MTYQNVLKEMQVINSLVECEETMSEDQDDLKTAISQVKQALESLTSSAKSLQEAVDYFANVLEESSESEDEEDDSE